MEGGVQIDAYQVWQKWVRTVEFAQVQYVPSGFIKELASIQQDCLCLSADFFDQWYPSLSNRVSEGVWVCQMLLLMNGQNDTAWNVKRTVLERQKVDGQREMRFSGAICLKNKKSSSYYDYRLSLWDRLLTEGDIGVQRWREEVSFLQRVLQRHRRNYFAWMYRNKLYKKWRKHMGDELLRQQVQLLHGWLGRNPNDYSAYSWLIAVGRQMNGESLRKELIWSEQLRQYCEAAYQSAQSFNHIFTYQTWLRRRLQASSI